MGLAVKIGVRFNATQAEKFRMPEAGRDTGLNEADRRILATWLACAYARGIDTVMDFSARDWNIVGVAVIVGVFETAKDRASWLVVKNGSAWTLAHCVDGYVSGGSDSLPDILALIDHTLGVGRSWI